MHSGLVHEHTQLCVEAIPSCTGAVSLTMLEFELVFVLQNLLWCMLLCGMLYLESLRAVHLSLVQSLEPGSCVDPLLLQAVHLSLLQSVNQCKPGGSSSSAGSALEPASKCKPV